MRLMTSKQVQSGSALIESLVAVLVFSFGILALVSMQTASIRSTSDAKYRADASFLANQIIGQIWGAATPSSYATGSSALAVGAEACPVGAATATPDAWLTAVVKMLPGADKSRQQITVAGDVVTVRVCWLDRSSSPAAYHNHLVTAQINKNP